MIPQTSKISKQILESSLIFSAQGGRGKEKNCKPAKKIAVQSEGEAERQSSQSGFSSKKVRILTKKHRQFSDCDFWAIVASRRPEAGLGFGKDFEEIFEVAKQFLPAQTEVRRAKHG